MTENLDLAALLAALDAVRAQEWSGLSWGGFNLRGDRKSIDEVRRLMNCAERLSQLEPYLQEQIKAAQESERALRGALTTISRIQSEGDGRLACYEVLDRVFAVARAALATAGAGKEAGG